MLSGFARCTWSASHDENGWRTSQQDVRSHAECIAKPESIEHGVALTTGNIRSGVAQSASEPDAELGVCSRALPSGSVTKHATLL